jgi:kynurenine formamidase
MTGYDGRGARSAPWWPSRYGAGDERGALNELTAEGVLGALRLPTEGRVIELAPLLEPDMPGPIGREWRQIVLADRIAGESGTFDDEVTSPAHVGCHVDGLAHLGIARRAYNGIPYAELIARTGLRRLGAENLLPWVTRGVCLDIAALRGVPVMEGGDVITPADLDAACERQGVVVAPGDAVLIHTGWMSHWTDPATYLAAEPGIGWDAARWLTERRVSAIGADNWAVEVLPAEHPDRPWIVHQHTLAESGTYLVENVRTTELASGAHSQFLFIMAPVKGHGSSGAMVAPIAVV